MEEKNIKVRNHILTQLEDGTLKTGDKLPGARQIAKEVDCSFTHVQTVIESFVQCGILEAVSRSGTFVRQDWQERILPYCLTIKHDKEPLREQLKKTASHYGLWYSAQFQSGTFEVKVTHALLSNHDQYHDLSDMFNECCRYDENNFYQEAVKPFYINGKLCGIPVVFSPRVIFFNEEIFRKYDCPLPEDNWSWNDFIGTVKYLRKRMPGNLVYNWNIALFDVINTIVRSGGSLAKVNGDYEYRLVANETVEALKRHIELRDLLAVDAYGHFQYIRDFAGGRAAMMQVTRQIIHKLRQVNPEIKLRAVQLPAFPGGRDINIQGADLFCVRKSCTDRKLIRNLVKTILSKEVQDKFGETQYGIPLRRSSALKYMNPATNPDAIFINEIPKVASEYNIFTPEAYQMIFYGIARICTMPLEKVAEEVRNLQQMLITADIISDFRKQYIEKMDKEE